MWLFKKALGFDWWIVVTMTEQQMFHEEVATLRKIQIAIYSIVWLKKGSCGRCRKLIFPLASLQVIMSVCHCNSVSRQPGKVGHLQLIWPSLEETWNEISKQGKPVVLNEDLDKIISTKMITLCLLFGWSWLSDANIWPVLLMFRPGER